MPRRSSPQLVLVGVALAGAAMLAAAAPACAADQTPAIRLSETNTVPACVTPERLMRFLGSRNPRLEARFADIAKHYQSLGEGWRVRWDYAFYQMAVETNFLTYRRPDGRLGDVDPRQNNFAGIGTTGGGVPGDSYPDVRTGVLAQIQHLVAYSGEKLAQPIAPRTQLKQDDIVAQSRSLGREVHFSDLSRRWAVDKNYGRSIAWVADLYAGAYCTGKHAAAEPKAETKSATAKLTAAPKPARKPVNPIRTVWSADKGPVMNAATAPAAPADATAARVPPPSGLGMGPAAAAEAPADPAACAVRTASYGGNKTFLIRSDDAGATVLTALTVLDGFEKSMTEKYIAARQPGGAAIGEFESRDAALAKAREVCGKG